MQPLGLDEVRKYAADMEFEAARFYRKAAETSRDASIRELLVRLAEIEAQHEDVAQRLGEKILTPTARAAEDETARRMFLLQYVQPGLAGLMDGSVSTLAPLFAAAFATHSTWETFLVGLAASVGAGISMGFAEALSDDGSLTGRGAPWLRGSVCGLMTALGGIGHTLPFLIPNFLTATVVAFVVVVVGTRDHLLHPLSLHGHAVPAGGVPGGGRRRPGVCRRHPDRQFLKSGRAFNDCVDMFVLAHLSDPHLAPLPTPRFSELASKRLLGFLNWQRKRRNIHRAEMLERVVADLQAQAPDHIAVAGDLINISLPDEFVAAQRWLAALGAPRRT